MELYKSRKRVLPVGWYPDNKEKIYEIFNNWKQKSLNNSIQTESSIAAVVPHAGWFFSGDIAFHTISFLRKNPDTVIVVGGHLPGGAEPVFYNYKVLETPLGDITVDVEFLNELCRKWKYRIEKGADNTVEIQLPMIKYIFPDSKIVALRVGSGNEAVEMGKDLYNTAEILNRSVTVIASTDLTHYGTDYNFTPHGYGRKALSWVKNINDRQIIEGMEEMDTGRILLLGNQEKAACSSGAAVCAVSFANESGVKRGNTVYYKTSFDVYPGESFVGYAGLIF